MKRRHVPGQSWIIAALLTVGLGAWLYSGHAGPRHEPPAAGAPGAEAVPRASKTSVRVREIVAEPVTSELVVNGRTEPARAVTLRTEIDGRVVEIGAVRGTRVAKGDLVVRLDARDLPARLAEARAAVEQRELQYEAAKRLRSREFQSQTQVAEAFANLQAARATVEDVRTRIANTTIRAPFDGVLDRRPVEIGDYVSDGGEVATIIDTDPMLVVGDVAQHERHRVRVGDAGVARLVTGEEVAGRIRYVAAASDDATRTFHVELEVENADAALVSGVTAEFRVVSETLLAHRISPALLSLDGAQRIGVKAVDGRGVVEFHPVEIVRSNAEGLWVSGLPRRLRVITVGHGFVREGDAVEPVREEEISGLARPDDAGAPRRGRRAG